MKNILSLIIFLQIFLIFAQADTHDKLSARSSAFDEVSSTSHLVKRKTKKSHDGGSGSTPTGPPTTATNMTCSVSRYVRQSGYAPDCYCAIAFLYDASYPSCVICRTCLVRPLDGNQVPYGGQRDQNGQPVPPALAQPTMNSAYDTAFKGRGYDDKPLCDNYVLPANVELDPSYDPKGSVFVFPTFLLGIEAGQGDVAMACSAALEKKADKEAM